MRLGLGRGRFLRFRRFRVSVSNRLRLCGRIWLGFRLFRLPYTGLYFWVGFFRARFFRARFYV